MWRGEKRPKGRTLQCREQRSRYQTAAQAGVKWGVWGKGKRAECLERAQAATPEFAWVDRGSTQSASQSCQLVAQSAPPTPRPRETCGDLTLVAAVLVVFSDGKAPGVKVLGRCLAHCYLLLQGISQEQW